MDIVSEVTLTYKINNRVYRLSVPWTAPYSEVHEVLKIFSEKALEIEADARQRIDKSALNNE